MGKNRKRFNEAARVHKHGEEPAISEFDPNADILDPKALAILSETSKPKEEPLPDGMSKKKRKRFEQYIAKKAKKEERVELLNQLSSSSFDHKLLLSSARLGTAKLSKKEALSRALLEEKNGLAPSSDLYVHRRTDCDVGDLQDDNASDCSVHDAPAHHSDDVSFLVSPDPSDIAVDERVVKKHRKNKKKKTQDADRASHIDAPTSIRIDNSDDDDLVVSNTLKGSSTPKVFVVPDRHPDIADARMLLPVCQGEDWVMESINSHPVTVICGETGSGKTTQVPQFLYEAGYSHPDSDFPGLIGVTQPRRVAAVSMSQRVGHELNRNDHVSYQIRFDKTITPSTRIHFMTDGVLLKQVSQDLLLSKYSVIIVDEAHERNINTDILIGVLSRVVTLRAKLAKEWSIRRATANRLGDSFTEPRVIPFKLVIMSATLRVADFTENPRLFSVPPPVINVEARQFPVTVHFNRRTPDNHMVEAYNKVCKIHKRLPPGGILVFLTGQNEIYDLVTRLRQKFTTCSKSISELIPTAGSRRRQGKTKGRPTRPPLSGASGNQAEDMDDADATIEDRIAEVDTGIAFNTSVPSQIRASEMTAKHGNIVQLRSLDAAPCDESICLSKGDGLDEEDDEEYILSDDNANSDGESNYNEIDDDYDNSDGAASPMLVLPLYSLLSTDQQMRVFDEVPEGHRLCVVATNVAETSLTIPGIRYVVDCGKVKEKKFDTSTSIQSYVVNWTAKSSADQRAGRSGRTGPGHCYRLYSSAVYERQFLDFSEPEVLRMPIEGVVLQLKSMNIDKVVGFPFPTPPNRGDLKVAEKLLQFLGALDDNGLITSVGTRMSQLPIHPRFAKMLLLGLQSRQLVEYTVALVAVLSVGQILMSDCEQNREPSASSHPSNETSGEEDETEAMTNIERLSVKFGGSQCKSDALFLLNIVGAFEYSGGSAKFCEENHLRYKSMLEIRALRKQLTAIVQTLCPAMNITMESQMKPPSDEERILLRQLILTGFCDHLAMPHPNPPRDYSTSTQEQTKRYYYQTMLNAEPTCIDRSSILRRANNPPRALVFVQLQQGKSNVWMKCITEIDLEWVPKICKSMCVFGKPLEIPYPQYDSKLDRMEATVIPRIGKHEWELPMLQVPFQSPLAYYWFGRFLLEGKIISTMQSLAPFCVTQPESMTKETYRNQKKVRVLANVLMSKQVCDKKSLLKEWESNPGFLLEEVSQWVRPQLIGSLKTQWPPLMRKLRFDV